MLRTNWIFRETKSGKDSNPRDGKANASGSDFLMLIETLDGVADESLYTTEFVEALVTQFWTLYIKVFDWVFIPFVIQTASCVIYFSYFIQ